VESMVGHKSFIRRAQLSTNLLRYRIDFWNDLIDEIKGFQKSSFHQMHKTIEAQHGHFRNVINQIDESYSRNPDRRTSTLKFR